jgi:hypothetical protein
VHIFPGMLEICDTAAADRLKAEGSALCLEFASLREPKSPVVYCPRAVWVVVQEPALTRADIRCRRRICWCSKHDESQSLAGVPPRLPRLLPPPRAQEGAGNYQGAAPAKENHSRLATGSHARRRTTTARKFGGCARALQAARDLSRIHC